ncbi:MAG: lasso peptide biosynthesis B2 protein [Opitutaceae bacterium]|nr:lasso peptide biosynthesis B2 protein [Opitutaceae bacterium]
MKHPDAIAASAVRRFMARSQADRLLLLEALCALAWARVLALCLPFRRLAAMLGDLGTAGPEAAPPAHEETARRIGWAVAAMARYVPWDGRCLTQAIAGWRMLARRGIAGTVYLGVSEAPEHGGKMAFHAWLRCGSSFVTGGDGRARYQVLACFSRKAGNHD